MDCVKNPDLVYRLGKAQQQETDRMQKRFLIKTAALSILAAGTAHAQQTTFSALDANSDGIVEQWEMVNAYGSQSGLATFAKYDLDGNGAVSLAEAVRASNDQDEEEEDEEELEDDTDEDDGESQGKGGIISEMARSGITGQDLAAVASNGHAGGNGRETKDVTEELSDAGRPESAGRPEGAGRPDNSGPSEGRGNGDRSGRP